MNADSLHPSRLLPEPRSEFEFLILVSKANWNFAITGVKRESRFYGHVFFVLRNRDDVNILAFASNPRSENCINEDVPFLKIITWEMWKRVKGKVCEEPHRYFDCCRAYALRKQDYKNAENFINEFALKGNKYQVVGWGAKNCVGFMTGVMNAAGLKVPKLWRIAPWPITVSQHIEWAAYSDEILGPKRIEVLNIPSKTMVDRFQRLRYFGLSNTL